MAIAETPRPTDFIRQIVGDDLRSGKHETVVTRFPPEPNGYLHIGHAKSICLNFGIAREFGGRCHLRFDDTNPAKEEVEYVESIQADVRWLGFEWGDHLYYASDYFEKMYEFGVHLIKTGKAFVCDLSFDELREYRGTLTEPGRRSPYFDRSAEESLDLFARMRAGEFPDGMRTLRARIDMASPNLNMRDPVLYRIKKVHHHRTGADWCLYPMYDYAHCISDALEGITHSICTLEFEDHRPLYDWLLDQLPAPCHPQQIEFAKLNLSYTLMSKRNLLRLVKEGVVRGWDDPRMPTISGLRRRGYPPEAIRAFCETIGVAKANSTVDLALLEHAVREDLNKRAPRRMAVLDPLKLVITNYPEDGEEWFDSENNPEDPGAGTRKIPFSRELYIEQDDFREVPPPKYHRLSPGKEIRLKNAYYVTAVDFDKDPATGRITEVRCTYDPATRGGTSGDGRIVRGTSHWVSARHAVEAEVRLYENLWTVADPGSADDLLAVLNPRSLASVTALIEPSLAEADAGERFQFLRSGYFCVDPDTTPERPVFNRTITLRDTWAKEQKKS
ncbi:MAG: glutamine--tRNA ligase/YqeY domain fusion protein [Candidatus Sericytochromatia bacterium]|nr:glutamine--tRNA ligase/YqeY domain fusion protein [Candidatus Tanganyikabacteria bacterium]